MQLTISIVTPTLNAGAFLSGCLEAIRYQDKNTVIAEHIIVDGGSTDDTVNLARKSGCTVIEGKDNGIFDAINKGNYLAKGDLIGFLGADDRLLPGAFSALQAWYATRRADWVTAPVLWTGSSGESLGTIRPPPSALPVTMYAALGWSCIAHMSTYVTPGFFRAVGGFDVSFRVAGDYDFFARALQKERPDVLRTALATFARHGANASMVDPLLRREIAVIASRYASASRFRRETDRLLLKLWLNLANPDWARMKALGRIHGK